MSTAIDKPSTTWTAISKPGAGTHTLLSPYRGTSGYGFLFAGAGSGVADTLAYGLYTVTDQLWDLVDVGGKLGEYWAYDPNYWGTLYFHPRYWGTPDPAEWTLQGKPSNVWTSVEKPT